MAVVSVETYIDDALARVGRERGHFEDRLAAVEQFQREVREIQPAVGQPGGPPATDGGVGPVSAGAGISGTKRCKQVRELFAETVYVNSVTDTDESLLETISEELGETISLALAPGTDQQFTPTIKQSVLSASAERQAEIESMQQALDAERESLATVREGIEEITTWLSEADQTPLLDLNFEQLHERHDKLDSYLQQCERLSDGRQHHVHGTTSQAGAAGVDHHQLVQFLYQSFPVTYPVLATLANLEEICRTGKRRVRDHLVRRV